MKNPLIKRLPRELKNELGKYIVLFIFITGVIGIGSGFLVAIGSVSEAYDESFEKYNVEDGNFELMQVADDKLVETLKADDITLYENFYIEEETDEIDSTLRIFINREKVNKVCVMEGELADEENEIAIDRMYADNNKISVGDTISVSGKELKVTGLVALSDYSSLFSSNSDMMFDAVKFGVAVVPKSVFDSFGENHLHYSYSWKYGTAPKDDMEEKEKSEKLLVTLSENAVVTNYIPGYLNQAIIFVGDDLGKDKPIMTMFIYIVVIIIAFVFAITTSNTISKEATVIGTLRASGYTRGELMRHYLTMPIAIVLISALVGNILGYTEFKYFIVDMCYNSYSLPTYVTVWNAEAFILTTVVPLVLMFIINYAILAHKLKLSPLKFIRRDLSRKKKKKAFRLNTKIGIMKRFRLRIIFQNMPNYITIVIGIFFANVILLFGMAFPPLLEKYKEDITSNMICDYQYILKAPVETATDGAEKYCAGGLKTIEGKLKSEDVTIFGIVDDSKYVDLELDNESVYISDGFFEKFGIEKGDTVTLKEEFSDKEYSFKVAGVYYYPAGIAVFMDNEYFNETFGYENGYFNGYFSNAELDDVDERYIATKITVDDMTKTSRQMEVSMGGIMDLFSAFGVIMFMLIIYLLSKIIIEKNAQSISMTKILGYLNNEISGLYVMSTSIVVISSILITVPIADAIMRYIFVIMFSQFPGWMSYYVPTYAYVEMIVAGIVAYMVIAFIQYRKVKKVPLDMALKNVE